MEKLGQAVGLSFGWGSPAPRARQGKAWQLGERVGQECPFPWHLSSGLSTFDPTTRPAPTLTLPIGALVMRHCAHD